MAECWGGGWYYAECHYAKCPIWSLYAECRNAECRNAECHFTECHCAECHGTMTNTLGQNATKLNEKNVHYSLWHGNYRVELG